MITTCVVATLMCPAAQAFEVTGGNFSLSQYALDNLDDYDTNSHQTDGEGTISYRFGTSLGGQLGLSSGNYDGDFSHLSGDVHVTHEISPDMTLGAFIGTESYDYHFPSRAQFGFTGVEMNYTQTAFTVQTAFILNKNFNYNGLLYRAYVIDARFGLSDKVRLRGGLHLAKSQYDGSDKETYHYSYLGVGYAITPEMIMNFDYGRIGQVNISSQQSFALNLTYQFKRAAIFNQRASNSIIPGW
jgi:hypothetical protein